YTTKLEFNIDFIECGCIYLSDTVNINTIDSNLNLPNEILPIKLQGKKMYSCETKKLSGVDIININTINFKCTYPNRVLIKGQVLVDNKITDSISIKLIEICKSDFKKVILNSVINDSWYYLNFPKNTNSNYKLILSYTKFI
ncbi:MAG: hypothetical protein ACRCXT_13920, partial [Paraclostridium sp.]